MARRLRIEYPGALYHVINRGNYRRDVFESAATAKAFELTLDEACQRYGWRLHAYVVMRNHYHLALETPQPNLVDGMHWLQSTFATRFNRFRAEQGHLFQGRYQSILIEDWPAMARVANYLHLNPARAGIVTEAQLASFRWSSLSRFLREPRPVWLAAPDWLQPLGIEDNAAGWARYLKMLQELATDRRAQDEQGFDKLSRGWAIGTDAWRKQLAKAHTRMSLVVGVAAKETRELKEARWWQALGTILAEAGKTVVEAKADWKGAEWKINAAVKLRAVGAAHRWIAEALSMGSPNSVRSYVSRVGARENQQLSA